MATQSNSIGTTDTAAFVGIGDNRLNIGLGLNLGDIEFTN